MKREYNFEDLARRHGFNVREIEKVCRISDILEDISAVRFLKDRLSLYGGTALTFIYSTEILRLSIDLDLNYRHLDNARAYTNVEVLIIPEEEALEERLQRVTKIKRREMMIEESKLKNAMKDLILPMKDLQNYDFKVAFLLKEVGEPDLLYRVKGKYFHMTLDDLEMLMGKIFEKSKILQN